MQTDLLLAEAQDFLARAKRNDLEQELRPSAHWQQVLTRFHGTAFATVANCTDLIAYATDHNGFVIYRKTDSHEVTGIAARYLAWLAAHGQTWQTLPAGLAESAYASPSIEFERDGRRLSTSFLWHLCAATRMEQVVEKPINRVLEIGPGFGGLARVLKIKAPESRFVLVDLPESLCFLYVYLRLNFPAAAVAFVTSPDESVAALRQQADFVLLPSNLLPLLEGETFDVAINIASWGEMTQGAVNRYLNFLENRLQVDCIYSINQYGQHPEAQAAGRGKRLVGEDICRVAFPIGPHWNLTHWDFWGRDGFVQADPLMVPCLEALLCRPPTKRFEDAELAALAAQRFQEASRHSKGSHAWHRALWDSRRLDPAGPGAHELAAWGKSHAYPEYAG